MGDFHKALPLGPTDMPVPRRPRAPLENTAY